MAFINDLRVRFAQDQFKFSKHAVDQAILRDIAVQEIREAMETGEVIEDYPDDKYGPSCLVYDVTRQGMPLHIHCCYPSRPIIKIITVYEPDPRRWIDCRKRR